MNTRKAIYFFLIWLCSVVTTLTKTETCVGQFARLEELYPLSDSAANDAIVSLSKFIEAYPDSSLGYYLRGLVRKDCKDYVRANVDFTKALLIERSNAELFFQRGIVRLYINSYGESIDDFSSSLRLDSLPKHQAEVLVYRAAAYSRQSFDSLALLDIHRSIEILPTAEAYFQRGLIFKKQKKYESAEKDFTLSLGMSVSKGAAVYVERGKLRLSMGERIAGYLDMVKARSLGDETARQFLAKYEQEAGNDTLRFYNTPEIVVEALPIDVEKMVVKMVETTRQQQLSLRIAQTNINVYPESAIPRIGIAINELNVRLEELAKRTNDEKLLRKFQDFKSLLIKLCNSFVSAGTGSSAQEFHSKQRFFADMSLSLMEIQNFMEELQEYLAVFNGKSEGKK